MIFVDHVKIKTVATKNLLFPKLKSVIVLRPGRIETYLLEVAADLKNSSLITEHFVVSHSVMLVSAFRGLAVA